MTASATHDVTAKMTSQPPAQGSSEQPRPHTGEAEMPGLAGLEYARVHPGAVVGHEQHEVPPVVDLDGH